MADNQETPDVSARDISELLYRFDLTLAAFGKRLDEIEAQGRTNGGTLTSIEAAVREQPNIDPGAGSAIGMLAEVLATVREAAPLLNSRAVKAMRAGGTVLDYLKAGRAGG